jgi:hypothetical protein
MRSRYRNLLTLLALSSVWTESAVAAGPPQSSCSTSAGCLLREGTPVQLKFAVALSSKKAKQGDDVEFLLADDLKVGDSIVVPRGARAVGTVSYAKKAGLMDKPGGLGFRLQYLIAGSDRVRLRGTEQREGDSLPLSEQGAEGHGHSPIGRIKPGKNVEKVSGTTLSAYVDEDVWLVPIR